MIDLIFLLVGLGFGVLVGYVLCLLRIARKLLPIFEQLRKAAQP